MSTRRVTNLNSAVHASLPTRKRWLSEEGQGMQIDLVRARFPACTERSSHDCRVGAPTYRRDWR